MLGSSLDYVGGLWVNTRQGTLYYRYNSEGDTGAGVGTSENYYADPSASQMGLGDVAFCPQGRFQRNGSDLLYWLCKGWGLLSGGPLR